MATLVELYLKDYYVLRETTSINNKLLSLIDLDIAIERLQDSFTNEQWEILHMVCEGYSSRDIALILRRGFRKVRFTRLAICRAIEHTLGWEYSDRKIHTMVAKRLGVVRLNKEENKFVALKLSNYNNYSFAKFNIFNFRFDPYGRVVLQ